MILIELGDIMSGSTDHILRVHSDQFEAVVLLNASEDMLQELEKAMRDEVALPVLVLLKKRGGRMGKLDELGRKNTKLVEVEWEPEDEENAQKLAQIMANLFDWVHPR